MPLSLVNSTNPPSPTSQPPVSPVSSIRETHRGPTGGVRLIRTSFALIVAVVPSIPASAPDFQSRKSPAAHPAVSPLGTGDHVRPPSSVRNTPDGNSGDR